MELTFLKGTGETEFNYTGTLSPHMAVEGSLGMFSRGKKKGFLPQLD